MTNSDRFMSKIKEENIKPIPRWRFTSKNIIIWLIVLFSVICGALAFSIILFAIQTIEFNLISHMSHSSIALWLGLLPFLWIITLLVFLIASIFGLKNTRKGYKFSIRRLVTINVVLSILLGTLFFVGGGANWLENAFAVNVGIYEGINEKKAKMWSMPEEGYLSGIIQAVDDTSMTLHDFNEDTWIIDLQDARISSIVNLEKGEKIKIIGNVTSKNCFRAKEVRPWDGFGQGGNRMGRSR